MADLQSFSSVAWARSLATNLPNYTRELEDAAMRNYKLPALMLANGRILYNQFGEGFTWEVKFRNHNVEGNTGETSRNFTRTNLYKVAALDYRGYQAVDSITERELQANREGAALVKVTDKIVDHLRDSMEQALATEWYVDGNATGNEMSWHGFESMFGNTGTIKIDDGTTRAANAADKYAYPDDTYATLTTELGDYGGENSSTNPAWPFGIASPQFDFWSPVMLNYTSSAYSGATDTWVAQGREALREALIHTQRNASANGQITHVFLARDLYAGFLQQNDSKEQINVNRNGPEGLVSLGFGDVIHFDGVELTWDTGVPATQGYGFNFRNITLRSMYDELLKSEGPHYDEYNQTYNSVIKTLSNIQFASPRNFLKLNDYA